MSSNENSDDIIKQTLWTLIISKKQYTVTVQTLRDGRIYYLVGTLKHKSACFDLIYNPVHINGLYRFLMGN